MEDIVTERREAALWIRMNRPQSLNAITPGIVRGIDAALDAAEGDEAIRCVVLTGAGRAFCAGADLGYMRDQAGGDSGGVEAFLQSMLLLTRKLELFAKPTIAAVNGIAVAGGLEQLLCCDLVIAAASARIGDAHANYGLLPGAGGSVRLPRRIGATHAKFLMFTGTMMDAASLVPLGLVNECVADDSLASRVQAVAESISAKSPIGLARMKRLLDDTAGQPMESALRLELLVSQLHAHSSDMAEGLASFEEKRKPRFTGH
jgi:enoyl-CoA hydratase/carnithine racemase